MAPGLNCVPINDTTPAMNSTNATLLTTLSLDGTIEDFITTLQMEDADYTVDGAGVTVSQFQGTLISLINVESTLTDFEKFHPPQKKNPPSSTFIDFLDFFHPPLHVY